MDQERSGSATPRPRAVVALVLMLAAAGDGRRAAGGGPFGLGSRFERVAASVSNSVIDTVDLDGMLARVDVDALLERVDVDALLERVDVNRLLDRVDVNRLLDRVEVDRLMDRVDVDALVARVDVDALAARLDVDALLTRVDIDAVVERAGIPDLVRESTGHMAGSALDLARRQLVGIDTVLMRSLTRLLRRGALPDGPPALVAAAPAGSAVVGSVAAGSAAAGSGPDGSASAGGGSGLPGRARTSVTGHYAGPVARLAAYAIDSAAATGAFTLLTALLTYVVVLLTGFEIGAAQRRGPLWVAALLVWLFFYWWTSLAITGRTPGMAVVGLRVVKRDGGHITARDAAIRTLVLPVSFLAFGLGFAGIVLDRERRALHDLAAGTVVVSDWGDRPAELPTPLSSWLARRAEPPAPSVPPAPVPTPGT